MEQDEASNPADVGRLGAKAEVAHPDRLAHRRDEGRALAGTVHGCLRMRDTGFLYGLRVNGPGAAPHDRPKQSIYHATIQMAVQLAKRNSTSRKSLVRLALSGSVESGTPAGRRTLAANVIWKTSVIDHGRCKSTLSWPT